MPIDKNMTHSEIVAEIMASYKKTGKIGDYTPKNEKEALQMANAIAYKVKNE